MRLELSFVVRGAWKSHEDKLKLPMDVNLAPGRFRVEGKSASAGSRAILDDETLAIVGQCDVDPTRLTLVDDIGYRQHPDGTVSRAQAIKSPEIDDLTEGAQCIAGAIGFALGTAFSLGVLMGSHPNDYIADNAEDEQTLQTLGTDSARVPLAAANQRVKVFRDVAVDADLIGAIARQGAVSLYADALGAHTPAATYRELWRVLELAFQAHGKRLVELVDSFPPVRRLGFERAELDSLLVLRGRLSHAASRLGSREIRRANGEAISSLARLWSLVDCVVLSKREASSALDVEEVIPLAAFVDRNGVRVDARKPQEPLDDRGPRVRPREP